MLTMMLVSILGSYVFGVVGMAASLNSSPRFDKYSDSDRAAASYLWPIIMIFVVVYLPYELGKAIAQALRPTTGGA